jgi:hypothetical protein
MKSLDNAGEMSSVQLGVPAIDPNTGAVTIKNDMSRAKFDVAVDVGPTSSSKRSATVRALTGMMQMTPDPETQTILASMALMNMEGEGLREVRAFFRKRLVGMGVVEPTEEEMAEMQAAAQNQQPDPNALYLQAAAAEAQAKALKAEADTAHTIAKTQETEAKTFEVLAGIDDTERANALKMQEMQARQRMEAERQRLEAQRQQMMQQQAAAQQMREPEARLEPPLS